MAISDLTNTTWVFKDEPEGFGDNSSHLFNIVFTSNDTTYNSINIQILPSSGFLSDNWIYYGNSVTYVNRVGDTSGWQSEAYKTIKITGGTDVTNTNLINWLQANATLQETPTTDTKPVFKRINAEWVKQLAFERISGEWMKISSKEEAAEDALAGTWVFNDTVDLTTLSKQFNVSFLSNSENFTSITLVSSSSPFGREIRYDELSVYAGGTWAEEFKAITITSKLSEVTNGEMLLAWLQANAIKQSTTTPTLINFKIAGTPYQAEEGMTWEQWVNSSYNTGGYSYVTSGDDSCIFKIVETTQNTVSNATKNIFLWEKKENYIETNGVYTYFKYPNITIINSGSENLEAFKSSNQDDKIGSDNIILSPGNQAILSSKPMTLQSLPMLYITIRAESGYLPTLTRDEISIDGGATIISDYNNKAVIIKAMSDCTITARPYDAD